MPFRIMLEPYNYVKVVFTQWKIIITGPAISLALLLWGVWKPDQRIPGWIYFVIIGSCFFVATYSAWLKEKQNRLAEHDARDILERQIVLERDKSMPSLITNIIDFVTAPSGPNNEDSILVLQASIKNIGAPSIVENFNISIEKGTRTVKAFVLPPPQHILELAMNQGSSLALLTTDHLIRKGASQPVPTGGAVVGWLQLLIAGMSIDDLKNAKVDMSFQDVRGKAWIANGLIASNPRRILDITKLQSHHNRRYPMSTVMIKCPSTGKPLSTGMRFDLVSFESMVIEGSSVGPCPHCGQTHIWNKKDSWLADDQEPKQKPFPHRQ